MSEVENERLYQTSKELTDAYQTFRKGFEKDPTVDKIWDVKKEFIRECQKEMYPDLCELCFKHKKAGKDKNICKECAESPARFKVFTDNGETHYFHTREAIEIWVSESATKTPYFHPKKIF